MSDYYEIDPSSLRFICKRCPVGMQHYANRKAVLVHLDKVHDIKLVEA